MIKLQDFAREQGVTDRAIQKHLKKYAAELEGKFERKGPNGTWLSDEACEILRSKMKQQPVVHLEEDPRVAKLEAKLEEREKQLDEKEKLIAIAQTQVQQLLEEASKVKALEEGKKALEGKIEALEAQNADLSADSAAKDKTIEETKKTAQKALQELTEAHVSFETELKKQDKRIEAAEAYAAELEAYLKKQDEYDRLPFYKRWKTVKPTKPVLKNLEEETPDVEEVKE